MKVCPTCHLSFNDDANVCTQCGAQLQTIVPQVSVQAGPDHTAEFQKEDISANKVLAMIPYLMGWIGIIITLLAAGTSAYAGFHVRQALKIQVCSTLVTIIGAIIPFLGWLAIAVFGIMVLVINIICFFSVCKGEAKEPPIISGLAFLK
ncbi:MAG: zinc ribbon domain-containing protein [Ruminococcaceae bacterium]|nr:zinc ribbon domain-containing protein [Oscillospiraceae bacterium]